MKRHAVFANADLTIKNRVKIARADVGDFNNDGERNQKNNPDEGNQNIEQTF